MQQLLKPAERAEEAADEAAQQHAKQDEDAGDVIGKLKFGRADDSLKRAVSSRKISVDFELSLCPGGVVLRARDERGCDVRSVLDCPLEASRSNQSEARRRVLQKTGDTIYRVGDIDDRAGNIFIPVSQLTALRRRTLELLDHCAAATYDRPLRRPETSGTVWPEGDSLTFHNNVANSVAAQFYRDHAPEKELFVIAVEAFPPQALEAMYSFYPNQVYHMNARVTELYHLDEAARDEALKRREKALIWMPNCDIVKLSRVSKEWNRAIALEGKVGSSCFLQLSDKNVEADPAWKKRKLNWEDLAH